MERNEQDRAKLRKWMEKAGQTKSDDGALLERVEQLQSSSDSLKRVLPEFDRAM